MSQTLSSVSPGSSTSGLWYGSVGKSGSVQANGVSFDQTLVAMLAGEGKSQQGVLSGQLALLSGLIEGAEGQMTEEGTADLGALLQGLLEQLDQLDQALADHPELLADLQAWIQNVQSFLQFGGSGQTAANGGMEASLPEIAEHPQTIRFAVQDVLLQLANAAASSKAASGLMADPSQAKALMDSLQGIMTSAFHLSGEGKSSDQLTNRQGAVSGKEAAQAGTGHEAGVKSAVHPSILQAASKTDSGANTVQANMNALVQNGESGSEANAESADSNNPLQSGNIVTAGQLAIREGAAAPLKAAAPPVPVEKFGQEMGRFLVSKLEIIKSGSLSEAKISLFPEHLGQVDVKITMQNGHMVAQFMTEHSFAKESLEAQMAQLRAALQSQGLQVGKLEVTQNASLSSHMYHDGGQSGNGANQQQNGKRREMLPEEDFLEINDLNEEWNDWISEVRSRETGSSFVAKA